MTDRSRHDIHDLLRIMSQLRAPDGCPWDREQTHKSLLPYMVEETYEVYDAVEAEDDAETCIELGDLLLQIVFHAQIAAERSAFDFTDITDAISAKLIRRHPHVFKPEDAPGMDTPEKVLANWEKLKRKERGGEASALAGLPKGLPAMIYAHRMQEKASMVGFDWKQPEQVLEKVFEEVEELKADFGSPDKRAEEIGDLLFTLVNLARHLKLTAEDCLRLSIHKFKRRFEGMENLAKEQGGHLSEMSPEQLDSLWNEIKKEKL